MTPEDARRLLREFQRGKASEDSVLRAFQAAPAVDLGYAVLDTHRSLRKGFPEVIFGEGKTPAQVVGIARELMRNETRLLVTRITPAHVRPFQKVFPEAAYHEAARCLTLGPSKRTRPPGTIAIVCAGTSDLPVAEEAAVTAEIMGNDVLRISDVGVAGLHRLLRRLPELQQATVLIAVAGMEGALPSVLAGLVDRPVIAVPTSVGYGANFGGLASLLAMLNSCSSGLTVVNINNGFGAAYAASQINALAHSKHPSS